MNTADKLMCKITHNELMEEHFTEFVHFESPEHITCMFKMQTYLHSGHYTLSVSNNDL